MTDNFVIQYFIKGGWIMWPLLATSLVALTVVLERLIWWHFENRNVNLDGLEKVYAAMERGQLREAESMAQGSPDPVLRVIEYGLKNAGASLKSSLQIAAGIELERASRFLVAMDTIVTLAPLLGLLGTVTGLMRAFFKLGSVELSADAISGGIAEALIATACGLTIAVICLVALNLCAARVAKFQFQLENACTNTLVFVKAAAVPKPDPELMLIPIAHAA